MGDDTMDGETPTRTPLRADEDWKAILAKPPPPARERTLGDPPEDPPHTAEHGDGLPEEDNRPEIVISSDEHLVNAAACSALQSDADLFQRGGELVQISRDGSPLAGITRPKGWPSIRSLPKPLTREAMTRTAKWYRFNESNKRIAAHPPEWAVNALHSRGQWPGIRYLEGVVQYPFLRPDGSVVSAPGYDAATGFFYVPAGPVDPIPAEPLLEHAQVALERLKDVVVDFPFATPAHRSAWIAGLLTPLARQAFSGPSPLIAIDANVRGSGKSKLIDVVSALITSSEMTKSPFTQNEDEFRKRVFAIARGGDPLTLIDNVNAPLGGAALDAALTSTRWTDRVLGLSENATLPLLTCWYATGNNMVFLGDTARRTLHVRLESHEENPEKRKGFVHEDLLAWVKKHRPMLLAQALTLLRAFCMAGKPRQEVEPWGSFEGWSSLIRGTLVWAGEPDPGDTRSQLADGGDVEVGQLASLLKGWKKLDPEGAGLTVAAALQKVVLDSTYKDGMREHGELHAALVEICPGKGSAAFNPVRLGSLLRKFRGRVCGGVLFRATTAHGGVNAWKVCNV